MKNYLTLQLEICKQRFGLQNVMDWLWLAQPPNLQDCLKLTVVDYIP